MAARQDEVEEVHAFNRVGSIVLLERAGLRSNFPFPWKVRPNVDRDYLFERPSEYEPAKECLDEQAKEQAAQDDDHQKS